MLNCFEVDQLCTATRSGSGCDLLRLSASASDTHAGSENAEQNPHECQTPTQAGQLLCHGPSRRAGDKDQVSFLLPRGTQRRHAEAAWGCRRWRPDLTPFQERNGVPTHVTASWWSFGA